MEIAPLLQLFLPLLTSLLGGAGVIPSSLQALVATTSQVVPKLIADLFANKGSITGETLVALQAVQAEIAALRNSGLLLTLNQANLIETLDESISNSIVAYEESLQVTDPSGMAPLPTDLKPDAS